MQVLVNNVISFRLNLPWDKRDSLANLRKYHYLSDLHTFLNSSHYQETYKKEQNCTREQDQTVTFTNIISSSPTSSAQI